MSNDQLGIMVIGASSVDRAQMIEATRLVPGCQTRASVRDHTTLASRIGSKEVSVLLMAPGLDQDARIKALGVVEQARPGMVVIAAVAADVPGPDRTTLRRLGVAQILGLGSNAGAEDLAIGLRESLHATFPDHVMASDESPFEDDASDAKSEPETGSSAYRDPATGSWRLHRPVEHAEPASFPRLPAILAIGISTGGPQALEQFLPAFSPALSVPVVIVQHMPETFTDLLAERLNQRCRVPVAVAQEGQPLTSGTVVIAPGGRHLVITGTRREPVLHLTDDPPENHCRPSVDPLFRSVADIYGNAAIALVMTGMGNDGAAGCRTIKQTGGLVLIQDEASSTVWGMPGAVASAGLADGVLPLDRLTELLSRKLG